MLLPLLSAKFTTIAEARRLLGVAYLGGINTSSKLQKNLKISGHYTYIVYLAPANTSGYNVCSHSTPECRSGCLATSGRALIELRYGGNRIQQSRVKKTITLKTNPTFFVEWLAAEIATAKAKAAKDGYLFSVRLNGTSDVDYTKIRVSGKNIFEMFPDVTFYDYSKNFRRFNNLPSNYLLTYSYTGRNWNHCEDLLKQGYNVAMIFNVDKKQPLPDTYKDYTVINGDITDLRVAEGHGIIVGLYWKNIADQKMNDIVKKSIFVIQPNDVNINN